MILPIIVTDWRLVALDLADPHDLTGGTHDYAYLDNGDERDGTPMTNLAACLRARIHGGYKDQHAITALAYDTEVAEGIVWLGG